MKRLFNLIRNEWERSVCAVAGLVLLLYLAVWLLGLGEDRQPLYGGSHGTPIGDRLNAATAWAFLAPDQRLTREFNPFAFTLSGERPERVVVRVERPDPPVVPPPVNPPPPPPPIKPPPPKEQRIFVYQGMIKLSTPVALVRDLGSAKVVPLQVKQKIDGFEIVGFDNDKLEIRTPAGDTVVIPTGGQQAFEID